MTVVVVPALDEAATIARVVRGFLARPEVDRVLVVDNGSSDGTTDRAREAGAEVLPETRRGYGAALRAGIDHACRQGADRIVLIEADDTFFPEDLPLLLGPLDGHDLVLGTRRGSEGVGAAQDLANRLLAAGLSLLWPRGGPWMTDVGCTYRALTAAAWERLSGSNRAPGPEFSPQMICLARRLNLRTAERPVRCRSRAAGTSKHTGNTRALLATALRMLRTIAIERLGPRQHSE